MVNTAKFIDQAVLEIRNAAAGKGVVMALSGGVDSSVAAALAAKAIGYKTGADLCRYRAHEKGRDRTDPAPVR